jgi:hypothetical protein
MLIPNFLTYHKLFPRLYAPNILASKNWYAARILKGYEYIFNHGMIVPMSITLFSDSTICCTNCLYSVTDKQTVHNFCTVICLLPCPGAHTIPLRVDDHNVIRQIASSTSCNEDAHQTPAGG